MEPQDQEGLATTKQTLTLTEYLPARDVPLGTADVAVLRRAVRSIDVAPAWGLPGTYDITPGSEVGVVALPGCDVVIRPKIPAGAVLFLLAYALDVSRWQHVAAAWGETEDILEGMASVFAREVRRALRQGILQNYRTAEEALQTMRGRVRFDEQLRRRFSRTVPIEVRYDDFTTDNDFNRVLRAALWRISRLPLRSDESRSSLAFCSSVLSETVELVHYDTSALPTFHWTRVNDRYRFAVELALMILRSTSVEIAHGRTRAAGFVIDMNEVFESFVRIGLRETLRLSAVSFPGSGQRSVVLDTRERVHLEPDLSWWVDDRCIFVGDAKYKKVSVSGINHPDLYQLLAYTVALDLPSGLLVYGAGEADGVEHKVVHVNKRLHVTTLDLSGSPAEMLADVARIGRIVRRLATESVPFLGNAGARSATV